MVPGTLAPELNRFKNTSKPVSRMEKISSFPMQPLVGQLWLF